MTNDLGDRYGRPSDERGSRRGVRAGIAAAIVMTVATVGFWGMTQLQKGAEATLSHGVVNFSVPDDASISADITITVQPGTPLACALEATNAQHLVVGWNVIDVPASDAATQLLTESVRTTQRASAIVVKSCWVP